MQINMKAMLLYKANVLAVVSALTTVALALLVCVPVYAAFFKTGKVSYYVVSYFIYLAIFLLLMSSLALKMRRWAYCVLGVFLGYLSGTFAYVTYSLLSGVERAISSMDHFGWDVVLVMLWVSGITCCWALGGMTFYIYRAVMVRQQK